MTKQYLAALKLSRPSGRDSFFVSPIALIFGSMVLTILAYLPGLSGPFLFDDPPNILIPMRAWLIGQTGWQEIVFGNRSGALGRPLSMLSFAINGATTGLEVLPFKATNLAIHLLCGITLFALLSRLLIRDPLLAPRTRTVAALIAAVWLLHPMQVSTVLYVVQRMAQLSTLFVLVALLCYVIGRTALEEQKTRRSVLFLFVLLPASTVAAMLSKENGAIVPLLCAAIELGYFQRTQTVRTTNQVRVFFAMFLALPICVAFVGFALNPARLLEGYDGRLFTLSERLLSQPRAILEYISALLLPSGPTLGVYTDDFPISYSLFDPPSTFFALLGMVALTMFAVLLRTRVPAVFTGIAIYLAGHVIESTVFPLELYFEHRNYLPSFGIFLAVAGMIGWTIPRLLRDSTQERITRFLSVTLGVIILLLAGATWARSGVWSSWSILAEQGIQQHPNSRRAHLDHISMLLAQSRVEEAQQIFTQLLLSDNPGTRHTAAFSIPWLDCHYQGSTNTVSVERIEKIIGSKLELAELLSAERLANVLLKKECTGLSKDALARILRNMTNAAGQRESLPQIWRMRFMAARLFVADGQLSLATEQAALAWMSGRADSSAGVFLTNLYYASGDKPSAHIIGNDVEKRIPKWDQRNRKQLTNIREHFEGAGPAPENASPE